jgi:hypothetical protein
MTKKEFRAKSLLAHYNALETIAVMCGVENPNGKKLSLKLFKLETIAHKITTDYCNGTNGVNSDNWSDKVEPILNEVQTLFNNNLKGLRANGDARGVALKINDIEYKAYYSNTGLQIDWGGNGMLSPDFD